MKRRRNTLLIALAVVASTISGTAIDIVPSESTVAERIKYMDAVLHVRAVSEPVVRAEDHGPRLRAANPDVAAIDPDFGKEPLLWPLVEQDVEVLEVMKGGSFAARGMTIRVGTSGGHNGMHLAANWREQRAMSVGGTYVLFLMELPAFGPLRYSHFDKFRVDPPLVITPHDESAYAKVLLRMGTTEALAHIRDFVRNGQR